VLLCHSDFYDVKVPNAFASSFVLKSEKPQWKCISYCSKHIGTTWRQNSNRHSGKVPHLRDKRRGARCEAKQRSCYWRFLIPRVSYTTSTLPTGKQLTRNSTPSSCDVCINQFAENNWKNGGMATGSCTTMHPHTLHILCSSYWPNTAPLSCSSRHTNQISQRRTSNEIRRRHYYTSRKRSSQNVSNSGRNVGRSV
jgi:hypothetical protein